MALRKASAYSKKKAHPYTRKSKVKQKSFIKTIPPGKIVKYNMGNEQAFREGKLPFVLKMISNEAIQMRDNAIEATRQFLNKKLEKNFPGQHFFAIKAVPHHILRENKMLTGAGSDRMQTGMQLSFGKTIGRAALVNRGKEIMIIALPDQKAVQEVRKYLHIVKPKLPGRSRIIVETIQNRKI